jgi:ABC-type transport system substrate-binding protein
MRRPAFTREQLLRGSAVAAASMATLAANPAFAAPRSLTRAQAPAQGRSRVQEFRFVAGGGASVFNLDTLDTTTSGATLGIITNFNYQVGLLYLGGDSQLHYGMAERYEVSDDLRTYTFRLKPGIR